MLIEYNMKKILLLILLTIFNFAVGKSQVCTPDSTMKGTGISPTVLPDGIIGQAYAVTVSLRVPKDSTIVYAGSTIPITVDSARVIYISNLPDTSFKYSCNSPTCTWAGGSFGCARLTGMPKSTHKNTYAVKVFVNSWLSSPSLPGTQFERIDSSTIDFKIPGGVNSVGELNSKLFFVASPNPANDRVFVYGLEINLNANYSMELTDVAGKTIQNFEPKAFGDIFEINLSDVSKGIYFLRISDNDKSGYQKLVIE